MPDPLPPPSGAPAHDPAGAPERHDLVVVGAGVSGLTLVWLLLASEALAGRSILLVDGAQDDDELRTLSFWSTAPTALEPFVRHRWTTLRLHLDDGRHEGQHDVRLREHTYQSLFFADLQREVKQRLAARPGGQVVDGRVRDVRQDADGATLTVTLTAGRRRTVRAGWVLDSRFHLRELAVERRYHDLRQHFHGWIVRTPFDAFDPAVATLLDFRADVPPGTGFCYVLPFTAREALVELVTLQPVDAEALVRAYLRRTLGTSDLEFVARESGVSPMTEQPFAWRDGPRVRRLGVACGRLKPSTGYALTRIVEDCAAVVASLERTGHPFVRPATSRFYRLLDAVLLEVWSRTPAVIPGVFAAMFLRNPADRVLRFLDERASSADVVRLIAVLPKRPFLRAAARLLTRRRPAISRRA